jgi:hypothetical protein
MPESRRDDLFFREQAAQASVVQRAQLKQRGGHKRVVLLACEFRDHGVDAVLIFQRLDYVHHRLPPSGTVIRSRAFERRNRALDRH